MSYRDIMKMPLRSFWSFNQQINRIRAEEDLRAIEVNGALQSGETYKAVMEKLQTERGQPVVVIDKRRNKDATQELRRALTDG